MVEPFMPNKKFAASQHKDTDYSNCNLLLEHEDVRYGNII